MTKSTFLWLTASTALLQHCLAFALVPGTSKAYGNGALIRPKPSMTPLTPLRYRALEEEDDETTMLKTSDRVPIGYDMKKALAKRGRATGMNGPLIKALLNNQALILSLATAVTYGILFFTAGGFDGPISNMEEFIHWTGGPPSDMDVATSVAVGAFGGALPMLVFSNAVENSDNPKFAQINLSTILMVMTLFGRRTAPPQDLLPPELRGQNFLTTKNSDVAIQSLILSGTTGVCEETVFRQFVPGLIAYYTGDHFLVPLIGQALLFGLGHVQPGKTGATENGIVFGVQTINGLVHGALYVATGGNILPCFVAHALYDFVVFFKTWMDANAQIEYAERMYETPFPPDEQREIKRVLAAGGANPTPEQLKAVKRTFYIFDEDKNKTLSLSEVRKGLNYLAIEKAASPPPQGLVAKFSRKRFLPSRTSATDLSIRTFCVSLLSRTR
jgi:membrane protease YdiL (CAAX protease family)